MGFLLKDEESKLVYELLLKSKNVKINIIVSPHCYIEYEKYNINKLTKQENVTLKKTEFLMLK